MRVLVTGGTGFLGGHVVDALLARGDQVRALVRPGRPLGALATRPVEQAEGDLLDAISLRRACRGMEGLIHCAVRAGFWSRQNAEQRRINVEGTAALLRAAHANSLARIIHVSTIAAVGISRDGTVLDETTRWEGHHLGMGYVLSKREAEDRALAAAYAGMPVVVVNPGALMGPRVDGSPPAWHLRKVAAGRTRWAPQGGSSLVDVVDVARGIVLALDRGRAGERYILAGHNLTWRALYETVCRHVGTPRRFREIPRFVYRWLAAGMDVLDLLHLTQPPYTPEYFRLWGWFAWMDSSKAARELGYSFRPLEETVARYQW